MIQIQRMQKESKVLFSPNTLLDEFTHLEQSERRHLLHLLQKYEDLFDGSLGTWKTDPIQLELKDPNVKPYHAKPYPVPLSQEKRQKDEIRRLCEYGVLRKINHSEWACPMFTISDGSLCSLADLREVNKVIKKKLSTSKNHRYATKT
jgi:hypothetical protein